MRGLVLSSYRLNGSAVAAMVRRGRAYAGAALRKLGLARDPH